MKIVLALLATLALTGAARGADMRVAQLPAVEDISLPFLCDWGYDWDERCYRDDGDRLGVGGVNDKVWRSALRFSLDSIPPSANLVGAELWLWYDGTCVAPFRTTQACDGRGYELDAHPIYTARWLAEREVEFGPLAAAAELEPFSPSTWVVLDVTDLVDDWRSGSLPNRGVLIKLADGEESYGASGPALPSSSYADSAVRPRLRVRYRLG